MIWGRGLRPHSPAKGNEVSPGPLYGFFDFCSLLRIGTEIALSARSAEESAYGPVSEARGRKRKSELGVQGKLRFLWQGSKGTASPFLVP